MSDPSLRYEIMPESPCLLRSTPTFPERLDHTVPRRDEEADQK